MTEYLETQWSGIDNLIEDIMNPGPELDVVTQRNALRHFFSKITEVSANLEDQFFSEANDTNDLVLDLEHIISVGTERIDMKSLPKELRNLSKEEYLTKLEETIKKRRYQKDLGAMYRTIRQRCGNITNFIIGMDNRQYEVRYKNPNYAATASAVGPKELAPLDRESEQPGISQTKVHLKNKQTDYNGNNPTGYASKNYPH